jgi:uncharacterized protein (TIGR02452 family)
MSGREAAIAEQTLRIVDAGRYVAPSGAEVEIGAAVASAVGGTRLFAPAEAARLVAEMPPGSVASTRVEVTPEGTAEAARRLLAEGEPEVAALNFASARSVGGGFLRGARAQEEDLCRASALYRCLETQPEYYRANRAHPDGLYTDHLIWSPGVPFFRGPDQALLEAPYRLSIATSPAPCTREILQESPELAAALPETFARRIAQVLAVAGAQRQECLVLGAWGCGAFRGDPALVAEAFDRALSGPFRGAFRRVVFAVLVAKPGDQQNLDAFRRLAR